VEEAPHDSLEQRYPTDLANSGIRGCEDRVEDGGKVERIYGRGAGGSNNRAFLWKAVLLGIDGPKYSSASDLSALCAV